MLSEIRGLEDRRYPFPMPASLEVHIAYVVAIVKLMFLTFTDRPVEDFVIIAGLPVPFRLFGHAWPAGKGG